MQLGLNIIFIVTCYPLLFFMYFLMRGAGNKNGYCFGTTISKELRDNETAKIIDEEYRKNLKSSMIVMGLIPIAVLLIPYTSIVFTIWMLWILVICFLPMFWYAKANKQMKELKRKRDWSQVSEISDVADDDKNWIYGLIYYNKNDNHLMVENRMGTGTAVNMAKGFGMGTYVVSTLALLCIPIVCVWMIMMEFTPLDAKVVDDVITCRHIGVEYEILLDEIESYEVVKEIPEMIKLSGTGMDNVLSGKFEVYREGVYEVFLNPQNELFIKIVTDDEMYYISGQDDAMTQELIGSIEGSMEGKLQ